MLLKWGSAGTKPWRNTAVSLRAIYKHLDSYELLKRGPKPVVKDTDISLTDYLALSKTQKKKYLRYKQIPPWKTSNNIYQN